MKSIGNMKDLKQHIEESLLDDFDTLASNQDKTFEHPWGTFWKDTFNGSDWEGSVQHLENLITLDAQKVNSIPTLKKGQVYVTFYESNNFVHNKLTRVHICFSKSDYKCIWDEFLMVSKNINYIKIVPMTKFGNKPHISFMEDTIYNKNWPGYLLSKKQSAKAIDMLKKFANEEWATYWKSL